MLGAVREGKDLGRVNFPGDIAGAGLLANTTGTPKGTAPEQASPMPDASMVSIRVMPSSPNSR